MSTNSVLPSVTLDAHAKINLTLDILGQRDDGFHEVAMVMQSIGLHDTLTLKPRDDGDITLSIDVPGLAADASNLAWRAAEAVRQAAGLQQGVDIQLTKRIPIAAGLAGGSTDAAAVLVGMNRLFQLGMPTARLCELGAALGSDIPFCIQGGTMLATGRGEVLRRLPDLPSLYVVLAKPPVGVSTAWAYQHYDAEGAAAHPDNAAVEQALQRQDASLVTKLLCNVLESVTIKKYTVISAYKQLMLDKGALASMMSGSGPTVFGLTDTEERAREIAAYLRQQAPEAAVFVTRTAAGMKE